MKIFKGFIIGVIAGIIDVIPMILQKLSWDANISAFSMWVVIGVLLSVINIKLNAVLKGIIISFMVLTPAAVLIGFKEPLGLIPISIMTLILGGLSGYTIDKLTR